MTSDTCDTSIPIPGWSSYEDQNFNESELREFELSKFPLIFHSRTFKARVSNNENDRSSKRGLNAKEQQLELIGLSQKVHLLNQEVHHNLRRNKPGINLDLVTKLPANYKRPPGFVLVPGLLGAVPGGPAPSSQPHHNKKRNEPENRYIRIISLLIFFSILRFSYVLYND